jgi:hypothetical protein
MAAPKNSAANLCLIPWAQLIAKFLSRPPCGATTFLTNSRNHKICQSLQQGHVVRPEAPVLSAVRSLNRLAATVRKIVNLALRADHNTIRRAGRIDAPPRRTCILTGDRDQVRIHSLASRACILGGDREKVRISQMADSRWADSQPDLRWR